ncbi:MAG: GNAT family N-acetyltransferase [Gallionella sp.]
MNIRRLKSNEIADAYSVVSELRDKLVIADFITQVLRQKQSGYELIAAFDPEIVGVLGMRPVHTLARGWHLHIDDLIVSQKRRKQGIGHALLSFAETDAKHRGMSAIYLDSVKEALGFYQDFGFSPHVVTLMRKRLT